MHSLPSAWQQEEFGNPQLPLSAHLTGNGGRNPQCIDAAAGPAHAAACSVSGLQGGLERKRLHQSLE